MRSVSIIGIGRLGGALAIALSKAGFTVENLVHRNAATARSISPRLPATARLVSWSELPEKIDSDIVLISTADPDISSAAGALQGRLKKDAIVLHTSGSLSSAVLSALAEDGHPTGSMHPLISVSNAVTGADHFPNAYFCVEGDDVAAGVARSIVSRLGGRCFTIEPGQKSLYHAAAVVASGHLVALVDIATEMLSKCGIKKDAAQEILLPLISTTLRNLESNSPSGALTGSFARTDLEAVRRHLASIDEASMDPVVRDVYLYLGQRSLDLAEASGADTGEVRALREVISIAKRKAG